MSICISAGSGSSLWRDSNNQFPSSCISLTLISADEFDHFDLSFESVNDEALYRDRLSLDFQQRLSGDTPVKTLIKLSKEEKSQLLHEENGTYDFNLVELEEDDDLNNDINNNELEDVQENEQEEEEIFEIEV